ncbi:hypothetical protein KKG61_04310 [bacterium]|nr:hypothetical protein [bacterium]MBU1599312.1 hypothetical protein [bacterium]
MMKKILVLMVFLVVGVGSLVSAADLYVPGSYPTIQAGINAAVTGDTVWVANGDLYWDWE